jgi:hypothetical protein
MTASGHSRHIERATATSGSHPTTDISLLAVIDAMGPKPTPTGHDSGLVTSHLGVRVRIILRRESLIGRGSIMANFILFLVMLFGIAGIMFYAASDMDGHGSAWASDVCSVARPLCDSPQIVAIAAAGLVGLWIVTKIVSALRG